MNLTLEKFTRNGLKETRKAWKKEFDGRSDDLVWAEYEGILLYAAKHIKYTDESESDAYGIFPEGTDRAVAILDVAYKKHGPRWMKVLDLYVSPALDYSASEAGADIDSLTLVFGAAVLGALKLSGAHNARALKLYGRSASQLSFFRGLALSLEETKAEHGVETVVEGRWLVFNLSS